MKSVWSQGPLPIQKTCLGEPIHNQQPYIPKEIYERADEAVKGGGDMR